MDDVISLRKEYSHWVDQAGGQPRAQNASHLHFVHILQQVKGILRREQCAVPRLRGSDGKENIVPQEKEAANIFEALSLEEPKDGVDSPNLWSSVSPGPKAEHMATSKPV